jgi:hypothetical protein
MTIAPFDRREPGVPSAPPKSALLELDDRTFEMTWDAMSIEQRGELPDEIRTACVDRKRRLAPWVGASVERARRTLQVAPPRDAPSQPAPLPGFPIAAIWEGYTAPPYLVKHLLAPGELTVLYGQSGHFKSVLAIDLALSVASGTEFHGLRTRHAGVLYVAGEGHGGIRKRLRAWLMTRSYTAASEQPALYVTSAGADLIGQPHQVRSTVAEASAVLGVPIGLVIIDTLAANFGPGDENHASEMQLAIAGACHAAPGAAVLLVHHVGHGQAERERGSYALVAAADVRVQASYDELAKVVELGWKKLKDDERPEPLAFNWRKVPLEWEDEDGEELTSVVLERLDGARPAPRAPRAVALGKNQDLALKALRTLLAKARKNVEERGDDPETARILVDGWRADLERRGIDRKRFREVWIALHQAGLIAVEGPHVMPVEVAP